MKLYLVVEILVIISRFDNFQCQENYDNLIKQFINRLGSIFHVNLQNKIHIAIPSDFSDIKRGNTSFWKKYNPKLAFKHLFSSSYVAANNFKNLHQRNYSESVVTILPFDISSLDTCEWMSFMNKFKYNLYLVYVIDSFVSKETLKACDINYDGNFHIFYAIDSSTIAVEEIYKINNSHPNLEKRLLMTYRIANHSLSYHSSIDKWTRRKDLKGLTFDGLAMPLQPYVTHRKLFKHNLSEFSGLFVEVMDLLGAALNFTVNKSLPKSSDYNDLIKAINMKRADIAIGVISITYDRSFLVDFSLSIKEERSALFYPKSEVKIKWMGYLRPFSVDSWIAIIFQVLISAFLVGIFSLVSRDFTSSNAVLLTFSRSLIFSTYSTIAKRFPYEPKNLTCRVAFVAISVAGFVLINLYKAMLGASLAIVIDHEPVSSMKDVLRSDYSILTMGGTSLESYFTKADKGSYLYKISKKKLMAKKIDTEMNKNGILDMFRNFIETTDEILVFFPEDFLHPYPELRCRVSKVNKKYMAVGTGFVFPKNWPYTKLFNDNILRMIEDGRVGHLKNKWLSMRSIRCERNEIRPSNLHDIYPLTFALALGGALSIISLFFELYGNNNVY